MKGLNDEQLQALLDAAESGNMEYLSANLTPEIVNAQDLSEEGVGDGMTVLMAAVYAENVGAVEFILGFKPELKVADSKKRTVKNYLLMVGKPGIRALLASYEWQQSRVCARVPSVFHEVQPSPAALRDRNIALLEEKLAHAEEALAEAQEGASVGRIARCQERVEKLRLELAELVAPPAAPAAGV